jgi:hypothetical protein
MDAVVIPTSPVESARPSEALTSVSEPWPEIGLKLIIAQFSKSVLERLSKVDKKGVFATPVVEALPKIAKLYKSKVKNRMDFRSIKEDRLPMYKSIDELRQDLLLVIEH